MLKDLAGKNLWSGIESLFFHSGFGHAVRLFRHENLLCRLGVFVVGRWESAKRVSVLQARMSVFSTALFEVF